MKGRFNAELNLWIRPFPHAEERERHGMVEAPFEVCKNAGFDDVDIRVEYYPVRAAPNRTPIVPRRRGSNLGFAARQWRQKPYPYKATLFPSWDAAHAHMRKEFSSWDIGNCKPRIMRHPTMKDMWVIGVVMMPSGDVIDYVRPE